MSNSRLYVLFDARATAIIYKFFKFFEVFREICKTIQLGLNRISLCSFCKFFPSKSIKNSRSINSEFSQDIKG